MRTASYHILDDVILKPVRRQSAASATILLRLVPSLELESGCLLPQPSKTLVTLSNDAILTSMRRKSAVSASILLRLVPRAKEPMLFPPSLRKISSHVIKRRNIDVDATLKRCIGVSIASTCHLLIFASPSFRTKFHHISSGYQTT